jgi:hypothetical protein
MVDHDYAGSMMRRIKTDAARLSKLHVLVCGCEGQISPSPRSALSCFSISQPDDAQSDAALAQQFFQVSRPM